MPVGTSISNIFFALQQYGFADFVIPALLIFGVVYALLQQVKILGENKQINLVIALAISFLITIPHVLNPRPDDAVSIIQRFLPEFVFLMLALLLVIMLLGMVATDSTAGLIAMVLAVAAVGYFVFAVLGAFAGLRVPLASFLLDPNLLSIITIIIIFAGVVIYVTRDSSGSKTWTKSATSAQNFLKSLLGK